MSDSRNSMPELGARLLTSAADLDALSSGSALGPFRLPGAVESAYRDYSREYAAEILQRSVYGLIALYLIVVTPIALFSDAGQLRIWETYAMMPIGVVLSGIWITTRIPRLARYVETTLALSLFVCLLGTTYCSMRLGTEYFGQMAAYETIYILIVIFSILHLPTLLIVRWAFGAYALAFLVATLQGVPPLWLPMLLYFGVPLLVCTVVGFLLEHSRRRAYVRNLCLHWKQDELSLLQTVADDANESESVESALSQAVERVCVYTAWPLGLAFLVDTERDPSLVATSVERADRTSYESTTAFQHPSIQAAGRRVAQHALETGASSWAVLDEPGGVRVDGTSEEQRLRATLACPIKVGADVVAVLVFFASTPIEPGDGLLATLEHVGTQLARVFERGKRQQERLLYTALHDSLTGLPNRAYLIDQMRRALAIARRRKTYSFGVLFLDVDRFKWVNDSLGHVSGDRLLVEVARRLKDAIRTTDVVARIGGDEFAILLDDVGHVESAIEVATRIHGQFAEPIAIDGHEVVMSASVGIAIAGGTYESPEEVLRDADTAMYHAKNRGRASYAVFEHHMHETVSIRLRLATELRRAIEMQQLRLHYQPIVSFRTGAILGFEALVRWQHPERGLLDPGVFVPLAEETGLIMPMTDWVLRETCRQLAEWQRTLPGAERLAVSMNMCAQSFSDPEMPRRVFAWIAEFGIAAESLRLEITETQIMENAAAFARNLELLAARGVRVYIDDFGTGYSSLSYLADFKVSALKIDRSFVDGLRRGGKEAIIVHAVVGLAHHLGLDVIAEGVETEEQKEKLTALDCVSGQGYLFSRPVPAESAANLVREQLAREPRRLVRAEA